MKPVPPEVPTAPSWTRSSLWSAARCLEHSGTSWWHIGPRRPVRIFLLTELGNHVEAPQKEPAIGGARQQLVSSWKLRAVPHGPGLFTLPFWQASSATLKPIHPGMPGPHPCPPTALYPLWRALPRYPFLPSSSSSHPPFCRLCQSAGRGKLGQGRTRIFNSKQIFPPQAASPFMHFFPYYHKRRNLH